MGTTESITQVNPEEDYKEWVRAWHAEFGDDLHDRQMFQTSDELGQRKHRNFWSGVGSAMVLFPVTRRRRNWLYKAYRPPADQAMFLDWLNVGHDFVSVCSRITEVSDSSESAVD
jgi:hypothetical protein